MKLDVAEIWARVNDDLLDLVEYIPDDKINWSPRPELWNFRGILLHVADARDSGMAAAGEEGEPQGTVYRTTRAKTEMQREFRRTWERVQRFVSDPAELDATYPHPWPRDAADPKRVTGHYIAAALLEHDIHHRADVLHYLALLGVENVPSRL